VHCGEASVERQRQARDEHVVPDLSKKILKGQYAAESSVTATRSATTERRVLARGIVTAMEHPARSTTT